MRRPAARLTLIGATALLLVTGCGGTAGPSGSSAGPLKFRLYDGIGSLDPALVTSGPGRQLAMFLYDRLVAIKDNKVIPALATKWAVKPDKVTFTVRQGATCSDGTPVTPSAVASSLTRLVAPATKSPIGKGLFPAGATFTGDDQAGTVAVKTPKAFPALLLNFTDPVTSVICPAGLRDPAQLATKASGSGPYTLQKAVAGSTYDLKLRDDYAWGPRETTAKQRGLPQKVQAAVVQNETTAANMFLRGDLDLQVSIDHNAARRLMGKGYVEKRGADAFGFLLFNQASQQSADPAVRKAIAQAVDPAAYAAAAHGELAKPSPDFMPPDSTQCAQTDGARYTQGHDVSAARKTLEAAGWSRGGDGVYEKGGRKLTLRILAHNQEGSAGEYLTQTLKDLGVAASMRQVELAAYSEAVGKGDWEVVAATLAVAPSPANLNPLIFGEGGLDWGHIRDAAFEKAMSQARSAATFDGTCDRWKAAQDALVSDLDVVPQAHFYKAFFGDHVGYDFGFGPLVEPMTLSRQPS
jgi:peptide/nickel transport system substrate-binding protein